MSDFRTKVFAKIFEPIDKTNISTEFLAEYAYDRKEKAMDNIEAAIYETALRYAKFRGLVEIISSPEEKWNEWFDNDFTERE